ncbi:p53-like transcription factor, DNA-binding [Lasallia pustulata]|uniref:p53-like transcription factor, DNA-binding n=1 Tax=Lasallia pustulata TaxID=136370 RepID=A0A1W5D5H7_9LECA|nr:p53-like transcription factor, DNA-binding [Lasallia pustulata]
MSAAVYEVMEGFDAMSMPYLANTISMDQVSVAGYMNSLPALGIHDPSTAFGDNSYIGSVPMPTVSQQTFARDASLTGHVDRSQINSFIAPALPNDAMQRYSSVPEDPFSDTASQYDSIPQEQSLPEPPSVERDDKLLRFTPPTVNYTLLDFSLRPVPIWTLTAQLQGSNFFLAESPWASAVDAGFAPAELTCYRRNIFHIVGSITLPRTMRYIVTDQGEHLKIHAKELSISATESVEGNSVKIITVPFKSSTSTAASNPEEKIEMEPSPMILDTATDQDADPEYATFPIAWKRLQFRIATANNGRRKELQQHFIIRLQVIATLETGRKVSICEIASCPIIVRGRSPRNFQRKDLPITGPSNSMRKAMQPPSLLTRSSSGESVTRQSWFKNEQSPETSQDTFLYSPPGNPTPQTTNSHSFIDWTQIPRGAPSSFTALPTPTFTTTPTMKTPPLPAYAHSSPDLARQPTITCHPSESLPLPLSLTDSPPPIKRSRPSKNQRRTSHPPTNNKSTATPTAASPSSRFNQRTRSSPPPASLLHSHLSSGSGIGCDAADLLYEYFPLGLDDWMPPVNAVYRPHVVHHTNLPREAGGAKVPGRGRGKRLYSECEA